MVKNKKSNFLLDNLGWILLSLGLIIIIIVAFPRIAEGFDRGIEFLRDLI